MELPLAIGALIVAGLFAGPSVASPVLEAERHHEPLAILPTPRAASTEASAFSARGLPHAAANQFVENLGQLADPVVLFYSAGRPWVGFEESRVLVGSQQRPVAISFEGSQPVRPEGGGSPGPTSSFFHGTDPTRWVAGARNFAQVSYVGLYEGIDLIYRQTTAGVKYEFVVQPRADVGSIEVHYGAADRVSVLASGALDVAAGISSFQEPRPLSFDADGPVECSFAVRSPVAVGFDCRGWSATSALTIDPLVYSTYFGSSGPDYFGALAVDPVGNLVAVGNTDSNYTGDFPMVPGAGAYRALWGGDVFVSKFDPTGSTLLWTSIFGGTANDAALGVAVADDGTIFVDGITGSTNFPGAPLHQNLTESPINDGFVMALDADGTRLIAVTLLAGNGWDQPWGLALGPAGDPFVVGVTSSNDFPTTPGSFQPHRAGSFDIFVTRLSHSNLSLVYSTLLGGSSADETAAVAVTETGVAFIVGSTVSTDFPTTPESNRTAAIGGSDLVIVALNESGTGLLYGGYFGGTGNEYASEAALGPGGLLLWTGYTNSTDYPLSQTAFDRTENGSRDGYLTAFDLVDGSIPLSTYIGGSANDTATALAVDATGRAYVTGWTDSVDFPLSAGAEDNSTATRDAFLTVLNATGGAPAHSTVLGGSNHESSIDLTVGSRGDVALVGYSVSDDFPTTADAFNRTGSAGNSDGFLTVIEVNAPPAPVLAVTPENGTVLDIYDLNASESFDVEDSFDLLRFRWDVDGDGEWETPWRADPTNVVIFHRAGNHTVRLQLLDTFGLTTVLTRTVQVFNIAPDPGFNVTPSRGNVSLEYAFNASPTFDWESNRSELQFRWDFDGDGTWDKLFSNDPLATRRYAAPGVYNTRLGVLDSDDAYVETVRVVTVVNEAPFCVLALNTASGTVETRFHAEALCADLEDPDNSLDIQWDFDGDGAWNKPASKDPVLELSYPAPGFYNLTFEAFDSLGASTQGVALIQINNTPPVAAFTVSSALGNLSTQFVVNAGSTRDREDGLNETWFRWDWNGDGMWDTGWTLERIARHRYGAFGQYEIRLEVMDNEGLLSAAATTVGVANNAPVGSISIKSAHGECTPPCFVQYLFLLDPVVSDAEDRLDELRIRWDFEGDGVFDTDWGPVARASHTYPKGGIYNPVLEVMDTSNATFSATAQLTDPSAAVRASSAAQPVEAGLALGLIAVIAAAGLVLFWRRRARSGAGDPPRGRGPQGPQPPTG